MGILIIRMQIPQLKIAAVLAFNGIEMVLILLLVEIAYPLTKGENL